MQDKLKNPVNTALIILSLVIVLLAFLLTYLIKAAMLFNSKKIQTGSVEFVQFVAITLLTVGLFAYLWISRF